MHPHPRRSASGADAQTCSAFLASHEFASLELSFGGFGRFLVHEDFVAIRIFQHHSSAVGANFWFAVKFHAELFHPLVFTEAVLGLDRKVWVAATLFAQ